MNSKFLKFHPMVNLIYFIVVIGLSMFFMHPFFIAISTLTALLYSVILNGKKSVKLTLKIILPMALMSILINMLTNRNGATIIATLPLNICISRESVIAGICTAGVIASAILWFTCFNAIITNEKLIYLLGRMLPSVSLILSMVIRFVPTYKTQFNQTVTAQKCIGYDIGEGNITKRFKNFSKVMSVMTGKILENSVETADSMRGRGFGLKKKTSYSIYKFKTADLVLILITIAIFAFIIYKGADYGYFPTFSMQTKPYITYILFFILCAIPIIIDLQEQIKWKYLQSKI